MDEKDDYYCQSLFLNICRANHAAVRQRKMLMD